MIVLHLNACPPGIRGDVTKWLMEIATGVYVGQLSLRTREELWKRVCSHAGDGSTVMVCSARNEQGFVYYVHNTTWRPKDFDGITLMQRPLPTRAETSAPSGSEGKLSEDSKAQGEERAGEMGKKNEKQPGSVKDKASGMSSTPSGQKHPVRKRRLPPPLPYTPWPEQDPLPMDFVVVDTETTGLDPENDQLIEMAGIRVRGGIVQEEFHRLINCGCTLPKVIQDLTGITDTILGKEGGSLRNAISDLLSFIGHDPIIGHHTAFDIRFIQAACLRLQMEPPAFCAIDTVVLARKVCGSCVDNFRLETLARYFAIAPEQQHRALPDAHITAQLYLKLIENLDSVT